MKTSEKFKTLEQMGRDKRSLQDILTAIARYRELAEAEEAADLEKAAPPQEGHPPIENFL
jgi:hypothetical protein